MSASDLHLGPSRLLRDLVEFAITHGSLEFLKAARPLCSVWGLGNTNFSVLHLACFQLPTVGMDRLKLVKLISESSEYSENPFTTKFQETSPFVEALLQVKRSQVAVEIIQYFINNFEGRADLSTLPNQKAVLNCFDALPASTVGALLKRYQRRLADSHSNMEDLLHVGVKAQSTQKLEAITAWAGSSTNIVEVAEALITKILVTETRNMKLIVNPLLLTICERKKDHAKLMLDMLGEVVKNTLSTEPLNDPSLAALAKVLVHVALTSKVFESIGWQASAQQAAKVLGSYKSELRGPAKHSFLHSQEDPDSSQ